MLSSILRPIRFARTWLGGSPDLVEQEIPLGGRTRGRDALLIHPRKGGPHPTWIVLHGLTRPGRDHAELLRFSRALASTGAAALLPEIPAWRELRMESAPLVPALEAALDRADEHPACSGPAVVAGFSFGCPQALVAVGDPSVEDRIGGVLGFGGMADPRRVIHFLFTGEHEWEGERETLVPDPYGRWVVGADYLPEIPGLSGAEVAARHLHELASSAGDLQKPADGPEVERLRREIAERVPEEGRELFDLFAPPAGSLPDPDRVGEMVDALATAMRESERDADPRPWLDRLGMPVRLIHGRSDRLIPWSETLRLKAAFPEGADVSADLTGLFSHSKGDGGPPGWATAVEGLGFLSALGRAIRIDRG